ncbi:dihydrofolate reductase family protein [Paenarthrobacter sp. PH39-S1]|uniref:dihydrofolate reductase family protein n=1 Tax=Paenarthrobacter sp. PH39-S1 TaxID=3046204 RepID=UPI0024BBAEEE|nr:dihydrofolate reductase family protein [Paenarthrobacter sp. PH39-S1]MDJ0356652.1 dihydrofolate reductase family protein [Paenarthrobacter sp. PH39-S1]
MRKIIAGLFISLDGVVEAPQNWQFPYYNDQVGQKIAAMAASADTLILGRKTYEEFAAHWSVQGSEVPFADAINGTRKLVASTTLTNLEWQNSTLLGADIPEEIAALKEGVGKNISVSGSPTLVRFLLNKGLLDELHLLVHPLVLGSGQELFPNNASRVHLKLLESTAYKTGVVSSVYAPADPQAELS